MCLEVETGGIQSISHAEVIFCCRFRSVIVPLPQGPLWDEIRPLRTHRGNLQNTD